MGFTESRGWKKFMAKLYGIGAAVVIIGALFKIMHWPGAGPMLIAGLGTEALIFIFSAFEPVHEDLDWALVYPELHGGDNHEIGSKKAEKVKAGKTNAVEKFDEMLEGAGLTSDVFQKLGSGFEKLNETATKMADVSDATLATQEYTENIKSASSSVNNLTEAYKQSTESINSNAGSLSDAYKQSAEALSYSVDSLADSYTKVNQQVTGAGNKFVESYENLRNSMDIDFSAMAEGNKVYTNGVSTLNKNLSALNAIFELQLQEADLDKMMNDLQGSVKESGKYHKEITKLGKKLEALNTVYGNMLAAMNVDLREG